MRTGNDPERGCGLIALAALTIIVALIGSTLHKRTGR